MIDLDTFMPLLQILALVAGVVVIAVMARGATGFTKSREEEYGPPIATECVLFDPAYSFLEGNVYHVTSSTDD